MPQSGKLAPSSAEPFPNLLSNLFPIDTAM
ncbi:hypothetical protein CsSME_00053875 [Camellia sinensis var. sinensis]